jgi:hypothetical protein
MKPGSHKWYRVTIHNYKVTVTEDGVMKVHIINPHDVKTYETFPIGRRDDALDETWDDTGDGGVDEIGDRHESERESSHKPEPESEHEPKGVGLLISQSADDALRASASQVKDKVKPSLSVEAEELKNRIGGSKAIPSLFGLTWFTSDHEDELGRMATVLHSRNRSEVWLEGLTIWAKKDKFWAKRIHAGNRAVKQLTKHLEAGEIADQFDSYLAVNANDDPFRPMPGGNRLLYRDYASEHIAVNPELHPPRDLRGGSAW